MAVELYRHNQTAYGNALHMLEETGRAAVIHPTGTGKSFIAFKLAEEHPGKKLLWLAPSEYIFRSQRENYLNAGGSAEALENITFLTYAKLMYSMAETETARDGEETSIPLLSHAPDYIVLDEFHRCGAESWGRAVGELLENCPGAKLLGLSATNIRYLDSRRDMAEELFSGNTASRMELTEAMQEGILPVPLYICGLYEYGEELRRLSVRVGRQRNAGVRDESGRLLEQLRHSLEEAEGPAEIFARHMKKDGKYIVFCSGREQMEEMIALAGDWYGALDKTPVIYRAVYDNAESPGEVRRFEENRDGHLKLLFCIDMLNEGVHVADVDGAVLLRPTASPTLYLQQIGRALSVQDRGNSPVIFDLVDNFDSLRCIDSFLEAYHRADREVGREKEKPSHDFRLIDETRESRKLFEQLCSCLSASWETCYGEAEEYFLSHGNLRIPRRYVTESGISLGSWLTTQRRVRAGTVPGRLTEEQIRRLDGIGMEWESRAGRAWERGYQELVSFREQHGHTDVPVKFVTVDGYPLGKFVSNQRSAWKNRRDGLAGKRRVLPAERERRLDAIGFVWEKTAQTWERYYAAAETYYRREGHLRVPVGYVTEDGLALGTWLRSKAAAKDSLPQEKRKALEAIGMTWDSRYDEGWNEKFRLAAAYYQEHGNLEIPREYTVQGVKLGRWVSALRSARMRPEESHYRLDTERIRRLDGIGMRWGGEDWEVRYRLAESYYREHGNLHISQGYVAETDAGRIWLGKWLSAQRRKHSSPDGKRALTAEQERRLEAIGMEW